MRTMSANPTAARKSQPRYQNGRNRRFQAWSSGHWTKSTPMSTVIVANTRTPGRQNAMATNRPTRPKRNTHGKMPLVP